MSRRFLMEKFLSARPGRGATAGPMCLQVASTSFYPHAPGGARRMAVLSFHRTGGVSIRTPRAGRDQPVGARGVAAGAVSIRTPRAGRDAH